MRRPLILFSTVALATVLEAATAFAQQDDAIIVTARKREESILQVPVAATALTGGQLDQFGTTNLYSMAERVPGLFIGTQTGSIGPQLSLRGVGTGVLNPTIDQSVSLNVDGVGMSQGLAFTAALFDMQQVEVLRGPQALFYGKNSPAGVISVTTASPSDEFEFIARVGYEFDAEEKLGELIISGPVTDTLGLRLAVQGSDMEGYFENLATGDGITGLTPQNRGPFPQKQVYVARGTAVWEPTDRFDATLKINYAHEERDGDGGLSQLSSCPDGIINPPAPAALAGAINFLFGGNPQFFSPQEDCKLDKVLRVVDMNPASPLYTGIRNNGVPFYNLTQTFGSLQMNFDITPELTLSSVTGYYDSDHSVMINGTVSGFSGPTIVADTDFSKQDVTQEIRLTSDFTNFPLNFMLGGFYHDGEAANRTGLFFLGPRQQGLLTIDIESVSAFGQLLWQVIPTVELAAGARWTHEERHYTPVLLPLRTLIPVAVTDLEADNVSPEYSITWTPTDDLTLFASYREGFKSGSWDTISNPTAGSTTAFNDESVTGYEGGVKARLFDRNVVLNLSAYDYEYTDLQTGANESTPAGFLIRTVNAASANVRGVDFDITVTPPQIEGLSLFAAANYNHARYGTFNTAPCYSGQTFAQGCNQLFNGTVYNAQDLSGRELLRAPDWSGAFGFDYQRPMLDGMTLAIASTTQWTEEFANNTLLREDFFQEAYYKLSASVAVRGRDDAWELALIGRNLNDEVTSGFCTNANLQAANIPGTIITGSPTNAVGSAGTDELTCQAERPREVWVRFTARLSDMWSRSDD